jgi:hypothetical protein
MKIESLIPLKVKRPSGDILLTPGTPVEFTEEEGLRLLSKAKGKVRLVEPSGTVIETAQRPDGQPMTPVYFERNDGVIYGPAKVTDFTKTGSGGKERFWVIVEFEGQSAWIVSDRLRSKKAFETQVKPRPFERIEEPR